MVALTAGAVACAFAGDAGGFLQGGPPTGISSHEFGAGGTGPICWEVSKRLGVFLLELRLEILGFGHSSECFKLLFLVTYIAN